MTAAKTPVLGRRFAVVHAQALTDTDLILAGDTARLLNMLLLVHSAHQGLEGRVQTDPRRVDLVVHLDGGPAACAAGLDRLREAGKLIDERDGTGYLTDWDTQSEDVTGSRSRGPQAAKSQPVRRHHEGHHADKPADGCTACELGISTDRAAHDAGPAKQCRTCRDLFPAAIDNGTQKDPAPARPALTVVPEPPAAPAADATAPKAPADTPAPDGEPTTTKELTAQFRAGFDAVFAADAFRRNRLDAYRFLLTQADEFGAVYADLSKNVRGTLRNAVLADALEHYLPGVIEPKRYAAAFSAANALSADDGHYWWVLAAQAAAGCELIAGKELGYLKRVAGNKRGEWLAGEL